MLSTIKSVAEDIWCGLWRPTYPLNPKKRRWDYFEYWTFRTQDMVAAILVFLFPPGLAFLIYERYANNSKAMVAFSALIGTIWLVAVLIAYLRGRAVRRARTKSAD